MLADITVDLRELATALKREGKTDATADALTTLAGSLNAAARAGRNLVGEVPLPLPRAQGIHPQRTQLRSATLRFNFGCPTGAQVIAVEQLAVEIQVCVTGQLQIPGGWVELEDHWRIDTQAASTPGHPPREAHPLFHFQRGGHAQDAFAAKPGFAPGPTSLAAGGPWRGLMQYPGPRIAVVPMCPVSAIDFAVSQHDGPLWRRLMGNPDYARVLERSQNRTWQLYLNGLLDAARLKGLMGWY